MFKPIDNLGYELYPTGFLYSEKGFYASILPEYRPCLKFLELFSHGIVIYQKNPQPLGSILSMSCSCLSTEVVRVLSVDVRNGIVVFDTLNAPDGAALFDIKPYFPCEDRVKDFIIPQQLKALGHWREERDSTKGVNKAVSGENCAATNGIMPVNSDKSTDTFTLPGPCGYMRKKNGKTFIELINPDHTYLQQLGEYSHIKMLWWFHRFEKKDYRRVTQVNPPYENAPRTGVFATRSPVRPNPIALTTARIIEIDPIHETIQISGTDAFDHTPVIGILPYIPEWDRVEECSVPSWLKHWPLWLDDRDEGFVRKDISITMAPSERICEYLSEERNKKATVEIWNSNAPCNSAQMDEIIIEGARQNNLKNIHVTIPKNKMTVVTGVSGSGKSSLAFDTVYAESRRRFIDSMSNQGISAFGQMEKPDCDRISNLPPAIAVEQKNTGRNPRSTVGTMTDLSDYLRLLFSSAGIRHCPECGKAIVPMKPDEIASLLADIKPATTFSIRALDSDKPAEQFLAPSWESADKALFDKHLKAAVKRELATGNGFVCVWIDGLDSELLQGGLVFQTKEFCYDCNRLFFELSPSLFSFNNPESMCPDCKGLGVKLTLDPSLIVSNPEQSILDGASKWWSNLRKFSRKPSANWMKGEVLALAQQMGVDLNLPWKDLPESFRHQALYGSGKREVCFTYSNTNGRKGEIVRPVEGAYNTITRLFQEQNGDTANKIAAAFMREKPCVTCSGERLAPEGRFVTVGKTRFPEAAAMTLEQLQTWVRHLPESIPSEQLNATLPILRQLHSRLESLLNAGVSYLALDRPVPTLSGGEWQRLRLASQLGSGITNILYVLDEPSAGLHPKDHQKLIAILNRIKNEGNTVLVVEHDAQTMLAADKLIDIGPGAGVHGGEITAQGTPVEIMQCNSSQTGQYLKQLQHRSRHEQYHRKKPDGFITLTGARCNNLKNVTVQFPLGVFCCITGVSGSGKSSLIYKTLYPALTAAINSSDDIAGDFDVLEGLEAVQNIISVSQQPIGRTPRSNPATYTGMFDFIRDLFANTDEARRRGYKQNKFSFNSPEGQCAACLGEGKRRMDMHFMPDIWVECPVCKGKRYNTDALEIIVKGKTIADILSMNAEEALQFFQEEKKIRDSLQTLNDVGLSYIQLGQSALTLSGGEAQRIKLAKELSKSGTGNTIYLLDEPTNGLHFSDIQNLLVVLNRITQAGNTVIVVEHNPDIMVSADWIIDLGPDGGDCGGEIVAQGTPEEIAESGSHTGNVLKKILSK